MLLKTLPMRPETSRHKLRIMCILLTEKSSVFFSFSLNFSDIFTPSPSLIGQTCNLLTSFKRKISVVKAPLLDGTKEGSCNLVS